MATIKRCEQFIQTLSNSSIIAIESRKDLLVINLKQWEATVKGRHTDEPLDKFYIVSKCAQIFNYDPFIARYQVLYQLKNLSKQNPTLKHHFQTFFPKDKACEYQPFLLIETFSSTSPNKETNAVFRLKGECKNQQAYNCNPNDLTIMTAPPAAKHRALTEWKPKPQQPVIEVEVAQPAVVSDDDQYFRNKTPRSASPASFPEDLSPKEDPPSFGQKPLP